MTLAHVEAERNTKIAVENKGENMKKLKSFIKIALILLLIILIALLINSLKKWPNRFSKELDNFFGKGNWECIDEETKKSLLVDKHVHFHRHPEFDYDIPEKYKKWYILFTNNQGEKEIYTISNHTYIINQDKYDIFSSKRYSAKQALVLELMGISNSLVSDDIFNKYISSVLPSNISNCISVEISYTGGNPKPSFYNKLAKEDWFNIYDADAEEYLETELHNFYIYIRAYDYKINKLSDTEKQTLFSSISVIENNLLKDFGSNASFEIYFTNDYSTKYLDGVRKK